MALHHYGTKQSETELTARSLRTLYILNGLANTLRGRHVVRSMGGGESWCDERYAAWERLLGLRYALRAHWIVISILIVLWRKLSILVYMSNQLAVLRNTFCSKLLANQMQPPSHPLCSTTRVEVEDKWDTMWVPRGPLEMALTLAHPGWVSRGEPGWGHVDPTHPKCGRSHLLE